MKIRRNNSLSRKIVLTIVAFVSICIVVAALMLTNNMKESMIKSTIRDEQARLEQVTQAIDKTNEVCNLASEIIKQSVKINQYMELLCNGKDMEIMEKLDFYQKELISIENMTNSNPYLYQVRIYVNSEKASEKAPSIYRYQRMNNMSWAKEYHDGEWKLDYTDTICIMTVILPGALSLVMMAICIIKQVTAIPGIRLLKRYRKKQEVTPMSYILK